MPVYNGSCLCKEVTFQLSGEFSGFFLCHCSRCRKESGSAHCANLFSKDAAFTWLSGKDHVKSYNVPATRFTSTFCSNCGSKLPTVSDSGTAVIPAGSLDCSLNRRPDFHIFTGSKADWDFDLEAVPQSETFPNQK